MSALEMNPASWPVAARQLYAEISAKRKAHGEGFGGPYLALLNHPQLARHVEALGFYLKFEGILPRPVYQFIVLFVARSTGADFEWHDHVAHARAAGLSQTLINAIAAGSAEGAPEPYDLLLNILTRTTAWRAVPDDLQTKAVAQWGREGLVEIVVVSGFYQMFAAINQGFDIHPTTQS